MVSRKITSVDDLSLKEISSIVNKALRFKKSTNQKKTNKPKNIFNLFLEASTRTTISFELASKKLGHNVINVNFEKSSLSKGETFNDTMDTLISMKPDALIIRDKNNFSPHEIYQKHKIPILNAGDGTNEHPTQALLDLCVIKSIFKDKKIKIGICGDIKHSRVAHSNIKLLSKLNHEIHIIAPNYFLDKKSFYHERTLPYFVPRWKSIEIDEEITFKLLSPRSSRLPEIECGSPSGRGPSMTDCPEFMVQSP